MDLFSADGPAGVLQQAGFYQRCFKRLSSQGMLVVNLWQGEDGKEPETLSRMKQALPQPIFHLDLHEDRENLIAFCAAPNIGLHDLDLRSRSKALRQATGLNLSPFLPVLLGTDLADHLCRPPQPLE